MVLASELSTTERGPYKAGTEQDRVEQVRVLALYTLLILMSSQIQRLRVRLNAHSYDHDLADVQPRHPTTGRGWHSRNLRCTSCLDGTTSQWAKKARRLSSAHTRLAVANLFVLIVVEFVQMTVVRTYNAG